MNSPRSFPFVHVDVFTEHAFRGSAIAVVTDASDLSPGEMQSITRELNHPETVFVLPATTDGCQARLRIFTRTREVPFAGYPVVAAARVVAMTDAPVSRREINLQTDVGVVSTIVEDGDSHAPLSWVTNREAVFSEPMRNRDAFARALGLHENDLLPDAPIVVGTSGASYVFVPFRDRKVVDRAELDLSLLRVAFADREWKAVFVFAPEDETRAYSRMFAPHTSATPEDPATGAASISLGAYLATNGLVTRRPEPVTVISEQGTKMGRQSFIHIRISEAGTPLRIAVGGRVVAVARGTISLP